MNKYRFRLGKSVDTSLNLVTNGSFTGSAAGWTITTGIGGTIWSYNSNEVRAAEGVAPLATNFADIDAIAFNRSVIYQDNVVMPGTTYYLSYKLRTPTGSRAHVTPSVGGLYYNPLIPYDDKLGTGYDESTSSTYSTIVHEKMFCHHGNKLSFFQGNDSDGNYSAITTPVYTDNDAAIDDVVLYPYVWNDPIVAEPTDWNKAKITKRRDKQLNGLIYNYIANLTFVEDGFDYLYDQYLLEPNDGEVPIRIEVYNTLTFMYELYYEGVIFLNDCDFDLTTHEVKCTIHDNSSSQVFVKGVDVEVNMGSEFYDAINRIRHTSLFPTSAPKTNYSALIVDDAGSATCYRYYVAPVYHLLRKITMLSSNYKVDFDSAFYGVGGDFEGFCISLGGNFRGTTITSGNNGPYTGAFDFTLEQYPISMKKIFTELNKIHNLSFAMDNSGSIPKVVIEPKTYFLNSTPVLTLGKVNNLKVNTNKEDVARAVSIGFQYVDDSPTETGLNNENGIQYNTSNASADKNINYVSQVIQSSSIIKKLAGASTPAITGNKYDKTLLWLETDGTLAGYCAPVSSADNSFKAKNTGSGTYDLNYNIDPDDVIQNQIDTIPTDFLKTVTTPQTIISPSSPVPNKIYGFNYPLTKAQFDLIVQAYNSIEFNTNGLGDTTKQGYLLESNFNIADGSTEFKLLSN